MFEKKITLKRVEEIAEQMRDELAAEIIKTIKERHEVSDPDAVYDTYTYQHALEQSMMNISTLVYKINKDAR